MIIVIVSIIQTIKVTIAIYGDHSFFFNNYFHVFIVFSNAFSLANRHQKI